MSNSTNYYTILGVPCNATTKEIHKSYKRLALKYHPDRNVGQSEFNSHKFHAILTAYEILKDEQKRAMYDKYGENGLKCNGLMPTNIEDLFDLIFSNQSETNDTQVNFNIQRELIVTLDELYYGSTQTIPSFGYDIVCKECQNEKRLGHKVSKVDCNICHGTGRVARFFGGNGSFMNGNQADTANSEIACKNCQSTGKMCIWEPCKACNGSGDLYKEIDNYQIQIPQGTQNGETIKILYEDKDVSMKGYLLVKIKCSKNEKYNVKLNDLYMIEPIEISLRNALGGGGFIIKHLGENLCIECNWDVIEMDEYHKIKGKGMLGNVDTQNFGDLFVKFEIKMPDGLNLETILKICDLLSKNDDTQRIEHSKDSEPVQLFPVNSIFVSWDDL